MDGATDLRTVRDAGEIRAVLHDEFLIRLPKHPQLDALLDRLPQ